jgi:orotidine-5'-phosphate decarboxylase
MKPLIVALDVESQKQAFQLAKTLSPWVDIFKVGPVLFLKGGSAFIQELRRQGADVFLDMKFHDIPSVVKRAVEQAGEWGVYSMTLHTAGGEEMMKQAASVRKRPKLWGVTVLTSLDDSDLKKIGVNRAVPEQVVGLAQLASKAGLDGVIASGSDAKMIKQAVGDKFEVITPGMRLEVSADDQKRALTPWDAHRNGADFFVVGRPILEAKDPVQVVRTIYDKLPAANNAAGRRLS